MPKFISTDCQYSSFRITHPISKPHPPTMRVQFGSRPHVRSRCGSGRTEEHVSLSGSRTFSGKVRESSVRKQHSKIQSLFVTLAGTRKKSQNLVRQNSDWASMTQKWHKLRRGITPINSFFPYLVMGIRHRQSNTTYTKRDYHLIVC